MRTLLQIFSSILVFSLLLGGLFTPLQAQTGFFSSILGDEAHADTGVTEEPQSDKNSQTLALLQANVSSFSVIQERDEKSSPKDKDLDTNANMNIFSNNALVPITGPTGGLDDGYTSDPFLEQTSVYVVRKGDTISAIAKMFDVSVNTILWANDMKKGDKLGEGDVLFILPISGLEHTVTKGQTLKSIAKLYKVDINDIAFYNGITPDSKLALGDSLMIPDAVKAEESGKPVKNLNDSIAKDNKYYETHPLQNLVGYFINPVPGYRKSQGIHDRNAVDLAIAKGTPIRAAAAGRVTLARTGYNGGFGTLVIIVHPNGTETLYAHMSKLGTKTGAQVAQGEIIGYVGSTGRSTGPHLHLEVHGARNPATDGSWAN